MTVLLTLQKIIPLHFIAHVRRASLILLSNGAWFVLGLAGGLIRSPKKLFLFSSIFFLGALTLIPILAGSGWKKLLAAYLVMFATLSLLRGGEKDVLVTEASLDD